MPNYFKMDIHQRKEEEYYPVIQKILFLKTIMSTKSILLAIELFAFYVVNIIDHLETIFEYRMKPRWMITKKSMVYYGVNH